MKGMTIVPAGKRDRFEILLVSASDKVRHVCAAMTEQEAIEQIMRSYSADAYEVIRVRNLGPLPKRYAARQARAAL